MVVPANSFGPIVHREPLEQRKGTTMREFMSDLMQDLKVREMDSAVGGQSPATLKTLQAAIDAAEKKISRISTACKAMWSLVAEHTTLTEKDLRDRIAEIEDLEHKQALSRENETTQPVQICPECDAAISRDFNRCLFCGYEPPTDAQAPFEA